MTSLLIPLLCSQIFKNDPKIKQIVDLIPKVENFLEGKMDAGHGIKHMLTVLYHAYLAVLVQQPPLDEQQALMIYLAALLHDVDDKKFFPNSIDYQNARNLLAEVKISETEKEQVIKMIKLVSTQGNGNDVTDAEDWELYPRWADRLEAVGEIGIYRTWEYAKYIGNPLFDDTAPRVTTKEELLQSITMERFDDYANKRRKSTSMMGHFWDKLFHLKVKTGNSYFDNLFEERQEILYEFALVYGRTGTVNEEQISNFPH